MHQRKVNPWQAAWRSFAAGFLTLQALVFLHFALLSYSEKQWYAASESQEAAGQALIVGVTIWTALRAAKPPTLQWAVMATLLALAPAGAYVGIAYISWFHILNALYLTMMATFPCWFGLGWVAVGSLVTPRGRLWWHMVLSWAAGLAVGVGFLILTARLPGFEGEVYMNLHILALPAIILATAGYLASALVWRRRATVARLP